MRNMMSVRFDSEVARQPGKAAAAAATADPSSSVDAKSTHFSWVPVAGLNTGPRRPDVPATALPPIQWPMAGSEVVAEPAGSASWVIDAPPAEAEGHGVVPATLPPTCGGEPRAPRRRPLRRARSDVRARGRVGPVRPATRPCRRLTRAMLPSSAQPPREVADRQQDHRHAGDGE